MTDEQLRKQLDRVGIDLPELVRMIARETAHEVAKTIIREHVDTCPLGTFPEKVKDLQRRVSVIELSKAKLIGFMAGAGAVGGGVSEVLSRLIGQ